MPIQCEFIDNPSQQDLLDLEKIYQEYPLDVAPNDWLAQQLDAPSVKIFAARFNNRLLGALCLTQCNSVQDEHCWQLDHLCVRSVTRLRGVAHKILLDLQSLARDKHLSLIVSAHILPAPLQPLLARYGFKPRAEDYLWCAEQ